MYFNEKGDTNIDSEFEKNKKFKLNLDLKNLKLKQILLLGGGIVLLLIIIFLFSSLINNSNKYSLELVGEEVITLNLGDDYIEPGYIAYDKKNNNVSSEVEITSNLDISKVGQYEILYSINGINKVRYITIVEKQQETYIQLLGERTMYLNVGAKYNEPGYKVYDSVDKDLKVIVSGKVDTSKKGTYQITYSVTNSRNITTSTKRIIVVQ